jgi:hypothetical protein
MTTFFIQTENGEIIHDFAFTLVDALKYHKWYYVGKGNYDYILSDSPDKENMVPVGSVEFVQEYLKKYLGIEKVKPLNIPEPLLKPEYLKRWVMYESFEVPTISNYTEPVFIKDNSKIKGCVAIVYPKEKINPGEYLISQIINIESEWRAFVYEKRLVGLQNYLGDFTLFPDVRLIREMIKSFSDSPTAYTLDVGINRQQETFILEAHDFFSCGLYGFSDAKLLPKMLVAGFRDITAKKS